MTAAVQTTFRLKADMVALTVIELQSVSLEEIATELKATIARAPRFFDKAPILIDVRDVNANALSLKDLTALFKELGVLPVGIRGLSEQQQALAIELGLPSLQSQSSVETKFSQAKSEASKLKRSARVITKAVRSGTKIYAKEQDLIIIGPVNVGAECIADGNIHVYGPLRGRALAGATGDTEARIFCHVLEAELIAIAGHYLVRENLQLPETHSGMVQIYLNDNKLSIESI